MLKMRSVLVTRFWERWKEYTTAVTGNSNTNILYY